MMICILIIYFFFFFCFICQPWEYLHDSIYFKPVIFKVLFFKLKKKISFRKCYFITMLKYLIFFFIIKHRQHKNKRNTFLSYTPTQIRYCKCLKDLIELTFIKIISNKIFTHCVMASEWYKGRKKQS